MSFWTGPAAACQIKNLSGIDRARPPGQKQIVAAFQFYPLDLFALRLKELCWPLGYGAEILTRIGIRPMVRIPDGQMLCLAERSGTIHEDPPQSKEPSER